MIVVGSRDGLPWLQTPKEQRSLRRLPGLLLASFRIVWLSGRKELLIAGALQLLGGVALGLQLLVIRQLITAVMVAGGPQHDYGRLLYPLAATAVLTSFISVATAMQAQQQQLLGELVSYHAVRPVLEVATRVELKEFDRPEFHDQMRRAQMTAAGRPLMTVMAVLSILQGAFGALGLASGLFLLSPLLLALVLLAFVPLWLASMVISHSVYQFTREMTPNDRKRSYVLGLLTAREHAKEVRAFGLAGYLTSAYDRLSQTRLEELRTRLGRRKKASFVGSASSALLLVATLGVLAYLVVSGRLELAAGGAAAAALFQLRGQLGMLVNSAGNLYESSLFINDLDAFRAVLPTLTPQGPRKALPSGFERIEVSDVHFSYPAGSVVAPGGPGGGQGDPRLAKLAAAAGYIQGSRPMGAKDGGGHRRRKAINGVSFEIRRGEVVALVGENGSGKTTLASILSGLYQPDSGHVRWDGVDTREVEADDVRRQVAVLFQDFARYMFTARENIGVGRVERMDDVARIELAAEQAGADRFIRQWPEGYEAMLGPIFEGGKDLSVGQWQRIALARAFFRDAPLVVLDEPTAALDARAEYELFEHIRGLFQGRAVLLISHRFSSVINADRIYVLKEGEVVEHGSHQELLSRRGIYAELFHLQASAYQDRA